MDPIYLREKVKNSREIRHYDSKQDQCAAGIAQISGHDYWTTRTGTTVPQVMQAPQNTGFATGIWQNCGVWKGVKGKERSGGGRAERGVVVGPCGSGWEDGRFAPVWKFLSVK